jgi:hypothetical protein
MIDIVAPEGAFPASNEAAMLDRATACLLEWETASSVPLAAVNIGAFLHVIPKARVTAGGKAANAVRVEVLEPAGGLGQAQRVGITEGMMALVAELASDPSTRDRTWVVFREAVDGGWGIAGRANVNAALANKVPASLAGRTNVSLLRRIWQALEVASS